MKTLKTTISAILILSSVNTANALNIKSMVDSGKAVEVSEKNIVYTWTRLINVRQARINELDTSTRNSPSDWEERRQLTREIRFLNDCTALKTIDCNYEY